MKSVAESNGTLNQEVSTSAHQRTPGEWKTKTVANGHHHLVYTDSGLIADVYPDIKGHAANARLIAAAPEMYEVLKYIARTLPNNGWNEKGLTLQWVNEVISKVDHPSK